MKLAMIGLGKMGANMAKRLLNGGHEVVVFDLNPDAIKIAEAEGAIGATSIEDVVAKLDGKRIVWVMVPSGNPTEATVQAFGNLLDAGDIIVDGGNSNYHDTQKRGASLGEKGIDYVDVGTSGGIWGLTEGYSMMVGGTAVAVAALKPALLTLAPAPDLGWGHVGPTGSGHYVKMIHNGVEYGLMQAYAEGFEMMKHKTEFDLDLHQVAQIWRTGSVVRSWLLDLTANALGENPNMDGIEPWVPDSGEGRWTVVESIDLNVAIPVITSALQRRFRSRDDNPFSDKLLSAMRNQFGGHSIKRSS